MKKWTWRICVTASLLLLVITTGMWLRAQWVCDEFRRVTVIDAGSTIEETDTRLFCFRGSLALGSRTDRADLVPGPSGENYRRRMTMGRQTFARGFGVAQSMSPVRAGWTALGFAWGRQPPAGEKRTNPPPPQFNPGWSAAWSHQWWLALPWWSLSLPFAVAPTWAFIRWRKQRRSPPHACPSCGYDLRATADPAGPLLPTCPECGHKTIA